MELLQAWIEQYNIPILSAFLLGLMTSISPCPLATNITATAYISKNIGSKRKVLISGMLYALGRALSYTVIGAVLYFGASKFHIQRFLSQNGEKFLGPLLIIIGLIMLNIIRLNVFNKISFGDRITNKFKGKGLLGAFVLGVIFALAFCPYSGALYFGILIPMTITSPSGLYLPFIFAIGTGLPVILFSYFLAFAAHRIGGVYQKIQSIERIMRYTRNNLYYLLVTIKVGM